MRQAVNKRIDELALSLSTIPTDDLSPQQKELILTAKRFLEDEQTRAKIARMLPAGKALDFISKPKEEVTTNE